MTASKDSAQPAATVASRRRSDQPRLYQVVLLNDDKTPMDYVTDLLVVAYGHERGQATRIMRAIHERGRGVAGTYPRDIAEAKLADTHTSARKCGFPLKAELRPEPR